MTERTVAKQSLLNDDAISINSTETEAFSEDEEFEVERVMAEKVANGRKYYLIAWLGYPEWKSTWEPKKHIRDQTILNTWKERKMREESGIDQPYDVARFEDMINRLAAEKAGRRRLRKAKRKRLGIPVSPSEASLRRSSDSESSIEAMEVNDDLEDDPGMKRTRINNSRTLRKPKKPSQVLVRGANVQPLEDNPPGDDVSQRTRRKKQDGTSRESVDAALPASEKVPVEGDSRPGRYGGTTHAASSKLPEKAKHARITSDSSSDIPLASKRLRSEQVQRPVAAPPNITSVQTRQQVSFVPELPSIAAKSITPSKDVPKLGQSASTRGRPSTRGASSTRGRGATRGGSNLAAKKPPKPRTLLITSSDPNSQPKIFNSMRIRRKAELQARAIADAAPDLSAIPGGLFDPSKPSTYQPLRPADLRKISSHIARDGGSDMGLFMDSDELLESQSHVRNAPAPGAFKAPPYQAPSQGPPPDPSRATCFFWDRGQRDPSKGDCVKKDKCPFIHGYERGVPVASPPDGFVEFNDEVRQSSLLKTRHDDSEATEVVPGQEIPSQRTGNSTFRSTCFFWDRAQRIPGNAGCGKKDKCTYLHGYEPDVPVAPAPDGFVEFQKAVPEGLVEFNDRLSSTDGSRRDDSVSIERLPVPETRPSWQRFDSDRATCYFWDRGQRNAAVGTCTKGDSCKFLHAYEDGLRIAHPPGDRLENWRPLSEHPITEGSSVKRSTREQPDLERATCYYWDLNFRNNGTGSCPKGSSCKHLHYHKDGVPVAPLHSSDRVDHSDRYIPGDASTHRRDSRSTEILQSPASSMRQHWDKEAVNVESSAIERSSHRPPYNNADPFNAICYRWHDSGSCPTRDSCKFLHSNAPGIPFAPKPIDGELHTDADLLTESERQRRMLSIPQITRASSILPQYRKSDPHYATCYYWVQDNSCKKGSNCRYLHAYEDGVPLAPPPGAVNGRKMETCKFWASGHCKRSAERCEYLHGYPPTGLDTETGKTPGVPRKSVSFAFDGPLQLYEDPESIEPYHRDPQDYRSTDRSIRLDQYKRDNKICFHWQKDGGCRNGSACSFSHELAPGEGATNLALGDEQHGQARENRSGSRQTHRSASDSWVMADQEIGNHPDRQPGEVNCQDQLQILESPTEQTQLDSPISPPLNSASTRIPKVKRTKMSCEDYHRKNMLKALGTRAKEVTFGSGETQSVIVDFGDLAQAQHHLWAQQLSALPKFRFDQMCIAQDLAAQLSILYYQRLWQGNMIPADPTDETASNAINMIVEEMKVRSSGLISVCSDFIILIYPKIAEWDFVEASNDDQRDNRLRFLIFQCNLDIRKPIRFRPATNVDGATAEPVPHRKTLVKTIHGLRFKEILPTYKKDKQNPRNFYLIFPSTAYETSNFLISWLHSSCQGGKVYSSQDEGSWDFFINSPNSESGVIFIHESVAANLYRFPSFQEVVRKNIAFWFISDSSSPYAMYPSNYDISDDFRLGQITATRLLPHGHVFFLTPSFIIAEPKRTCEILEWFFGRPRQPATEGTPEITKKPGRLDCVTPGTWKLVACHNFADYVLDLANSKAAEKKAFEEKYRDKPSIEQMLEDRGLDFLTCKFRYNIHAKLVELESRNILNFSSDECDSDFPDEQYSPIVYADRNISADNEESLVEWFAAWSLRKLDMYRKFTVVGTGTKSIKRATRMIEDPKNDVLAMNESTENPISSFKSFSIAKATLSPLAETKSPTESPMSPRQRALAVASKYNVSHAKSPLSASKTMERNPFDELTNSSPRVGASLASGPATGSLGGYIVSLSKPLRGKAADDDIDISMDISEISNPSVTSHGIDQFIAITGANANEAKSFLSQSNNDVKRAVELYESRNAQDHIDIEAQVLDLIASSRPESLPDADMACTKEMHPSPTVLGPPLSSIVHSPMPGQFFSPQFDEISPPQSDGAGDNRPVPSASDSNRTSLSGIHTDKNGQRFVPRSIRPSGSVRKEISVKPGYIPPEDRDVYHNQRAVDGVPFEVSSNGSKGASPVLAPQAMEIDSTPMSKTNSISSSEKSEWKDPKKETTLKEIKFEPTTVWYKRLKESGGGYEHLYVESWEKAFVNLGVHARK